LGRVRKLLAWAAVSIGCAAAVGAAVGAAGLPPGAGPGVDVERLSAPTASPVWYRIRVRSPLAEAGTQALIVRKARGVVLDLYDSPGEARAGLLRAAELPEFRGMQDDVFVLPRTSAAGAGADAGAGAGAGPAVYARVEPQGRALAELHFSTATLEGTLARAAEHARMIGIAFGALLALSLSALLIWFVLADALFMLYAAFFSLQGLYVVYLSGQGFDWPALAWALSLGSHAWNVPVALSGAIGCLFAREIADLRHFSPQVYVAYRWLAVAFLVLALANVLKLFGAGWLVSGVGNLMFVGTALFTLVVAFLAWRRGIRAAGWFLVAWGLLEAFTIATATRLLMADAQDAEQLLYYGLPLSMVAAAILAALGVADRLRDQRLALTEAERRAQTDVLTGVLNRRSLIERLEATCVRARTRNLPIALLFIDLDYFKRVNDTYGHPAGDACLRAIVEPIQAELRQTDVIGRYGGEEFVVILNSADTAAAHLIAERILERVASVRITGFGAPIQLTCSIGVAGSDTLGVWGDELIASADAAVYAAKNAGRNRVQVAPRLAA